MTMRRHLSIPVAVLAVCGYVSALAAEDLSSYRRGDLSLPSSPDIRNPGFENDAEGWNLYEGYQVVPNAGRNGTAGLRYERSDPANYKLGNTGVRLERGARYRYGAWVRCEDVPEGGRGATICLEFIRDGKWLSGDYPKGIHGTQDWTYVESDCVVPEDAESCQFVLYLGPKKTGTAWFDDVVVKPAAPLLEMHVVYPPFRRLTPEDGLVRVNVYNEDESLDEDDLRVHVVATAGNTSRQATAAVQSHIAELDLSGLPTGSVDLTLYLLDARRKLILAESAAALTCVPSDRPIPDNACLIDSEGRAIVDGKPFMPLGLWMYTLSKEDLDRIAESPFNCVMPTRSLSLKLIEKDDMILPRPHKGPVADTPILYEYTPETVRDTLDYCHAKGIRMIFSLQKVYEGMKWGRTTWFGAEGPAAVVTSVVNRYRDHPALLAWFINDERPASMMPRLNARRRLVNDLDPFHPTWGVLYQFPDLPLYGSSCDVIGVDAYPINDESSRNMNIIDRAMDGVDRSGLPAWVVGQIFNWGIYRAGGHGERFKNDFMDPTEEQMRSMALFFALRGAKGFTFYAYHDLKRPASPNRFDTPPQTMADFERRWAEVKRIGRVLKDLEPFILADIEPPSLRIEQEEGRVQAREFRDGDGNVRILIAGIGPGESRAVLTTSAPMPLESVYGNCTALGNNRYRFVGEDISSDILRGNRE